MTGVYPHANNLGEGEHRFFLPIYIFVLKFRWVPSTCDLGEFDWKNLNEE